MGWAQRSGQMVLSTKVTMRTARKMVKDISNGRMEVNTEEDFGIMNYTAKGCTYGKTNVHIQVVGKVIKCTEWENLYGPMVEYMKENTMRIKNTDKGHTLGQMDANTTVIGLMENKMIEELTQARMGSLKMDFGKTAIALPGCN